MLKVYSEKDVKRLVSRLKEEYDGVLESMRVSLEETKEENRTLRARVSVLEGERADVAEAMIAAVKAGEAARKEGEKALEDRRRELALLIDRCRDYLSVLQKKYPDEEEVSAFSRFTEELAGGLGEEEESGFDLEEVTAPKYPLDLAKLCRELGLMEDEE